MVCFLKASLILSVVDVIVKSSRQMVINFDKRLFVMSCFRQGNSSTEEDSEEGDKPQGNSDKGKLVEDEDFKVRHVRTVRMKITAKSVVGSLFKVIK